MLLEVRVIVERAETHRQSLEGLIDAVPDDYWARRAPGESWSAHDHLAHVATIDALTCETLSEILTGAAVAWLAGTTVPAELSARRAAALQEAHDATPQTFRDRMRQNRAELVRLLSRLDVASLESSICVAGVLDAWGEPVRFGLRRYLAGLPDHDTQHEYAIRRAITAAPDLSTVALTRRRLGERN